MARKANMMASHFDSKDGDEAVDMESAPTEESVIVPPAPPAVKAPDPIVKSYMVEGAGNGKSIMMNGYKALFKDGKIVSEKDYDIKALQEQGLRLREMA